MRIIDKESEFINVACTPAQHREAAEMCQWLVERLHRTHSGQTEAWQLFLSAQLLAQYCVDKVRMDLVDYNAALHSGIGAVTEIAIKMVDEYAENACKNVEEK